MPYMWGNNNMKRRNLKNANYGVNTRALKWATENPNHPDYPLDKNERKRIITLEIQNRGNENHEN